MLQRGNENGGAFTAFTAILCLFSQPQLGLAAASTSGPAVINAGPVVITPTLGSEFKHRSNIYLQEEDETESWIFLLRPVIKARAQDRENYYEVGYEGEAAWYDEDQKDNRNDYFDHTLTADAFILYDEFWTFTAFGSYAFLHEDRGTGLTEGSIGEAVTEPVEYEQGDIGGSVEYGSQRGNGRLKFDASYMDRTYQNFRQLTRTRDRDETDLGLTFFYPIATRTDLFTRYNYKDIRYPNTFENLPALDSQEHSLTGGLEWEITPNTTSSAEAGYLKKKFDDPGRNDYTGLTWKVDLQMQLREQDFVVITGSRGSQETNLQGDFIRREELAADWTHDWSDRVNTTLRGSVGNDKYEGSQNGRVDDVYSLSLRADYEFRRWANLYTSYSWDEKDSNIVGLSYTDYTFILGVDLSL
jgi:polysaccharide biosynthesis protein VpsM